MEIFCNSDIGLVRATNQDSVYADPKGKWCALADGMGGHLGGETASCMTIDTLKENLGKYTEKDAVLKIREAIDKANGEVFEKSNTDPKLSGMGTTIVVMGKTKSKIAIVHAGDSRAYLIKKDLIKQITKDHSVVQHLIDTGTITADQAKLHPQRNMITRAVGTEKTIKTDVNEIGYSKGDYILLCSDGLSSMIDDSEILKTVSQSKDLKTAVNTLISLAKESGGTDNITVALAKM